MVAVSYYRNLYDLEGVAAPFRKLLAGIKNGKWKDLAESVRAGDKLAKKNAPGFTVSGTFGNPREDANLTTHSGFGCIDVDIPIGYSEAMRLMGDPHIAVGFRSISGNYALLVALDIKENTPQEHKELMMGFIEYFEAKYGYKVDPTCKNVSRFRYVSYDPELMTAEVDRPWATRVVQETAAPKMEAGANNPLPEHIAYDRVLEKYVRSVGDFGTTNSRHEWILGLTVWCNRAGLSGNYVYDKLLSYPIPEREWQKEHLRTLKHVYKNTAEHGTHPQPLFFTKEDFTKYPGDKSLMLEWFIKRKIDFITEAYRGEVSEGKQKYLESLGRDIDFLVGYYNSTYGKA